MIFDRGLSDANASYWFNKLADITDNGWHVSNVQLGDGGGDKGKKIELSAVLLPEETGQYLSSIQTGTEQPSELETFWWATRLPAKASATIKVVRDSDTKPCR